ncbi:hypothetical protein Bca4012_027688 [Brassica carinata]
MDKGIALRVVKQAILPRVQGLALKTTLAASKYFDKPAVLEILQTIQRCTAVDRSAPTLMCTLAVANAILKQFQSSDQTPEKVASAAKSSPAWDEDWGSPRKDSTLGNPASSQHVSNNQFNKSSNQSQSSTMSTLPNKATTCRPVDIEWPPRQSLNLTAPAIADETQLNTWNIIYSGF